MRERPIGDLVDALNALGARIAYDGVPGFPPLRIEPATELNSDRVSVRGDVSSQFLTGLLMAAPHVAPSQGLRIAVAGPLISRPYVDMTLALMQRFGVDVARDGDEFVVPRAGYRSPGRISVEGDASGASYFLALGAIAGGPVRVQGVGRDSVQGDVRFAEALVAMGARVTLGDDFIEASAPSDRAPARHRHGPESHPGCRDDARRRCAVCRRAEHAAQHRLVARQGNGPHRRDGCRTAQAGSGGRRGVGLAARPTSAAVARSDDRYLR